MIGTNAAFRRASGFSDDQLLGPDGGGLVSRCRTSQHLDGGDPRESVIAGPNSAVVRADGSSFMLGMHLMPVPARTAGFDCFVIVGRDITEALQTRQMQASMQRLLAAVFTSVDAPVAIVNGAGTDRDDQSAIRWSAGIPSQGTDRTISAGDRGRRSARPGHGGQQPSRPRMDRTPSSSHRCCKRTGRS